MRATRTPFAAIPGWVLSHEVVRSNRTVLHVYAAMFLDADFGEREGDADWRTIGERTGLSRPTVYRDVKAMRDAGILILVGDDHYRMPLEEPVDNSAPSTTVDGLSTTVDGVSTAVDCTSLTELYQSFSDSVMPEPIDHFAVFWNTYPRHVGKGDARKAFERALKRATADVILAGALRFAQDPNLPPLAEARFIPHPATWLNQDRWADDPLPPRAGSARKIDPSHNRHATSLLEDFAASQGGKP